MKSNSLASLSVCKYLKFHTLYWAHNNYEIHPKFNLWYILFTRFSSLCNLLTSNKKNMVLLPHIGHSHNKYETIQDSLFWNIVFTRFQTLTSADLKWAFTSTKTNEVHLLNMENLHSKHGIHPSFHSWDILVTTKVQYIRNAYPYTFYYDCIGLGMK